MLLRSAVIAAVLSCLPTAMAVAAGPFTDVPQDHRAAEAIADLKQRRIVEGYADGTFRPDANVNRAEALKFIIAPLASTEELSAATANFYSDIPSDAWYSRYVELARQKSIVDGPPNTTTFRGADPVNKAEFLKILLLANGVDPNAYSEIRLPLATDASDPDAWYYPYLRYAVTASMTMPNAEGLFRPDKQLTRADVALFLYRLLQYKEGHSVTTLLQAVNTEYAALPVLLKEDFTAAGFVSARALLMARGAHTSAPTETKTRATVKIAEAFRALVRAEQSSIDEKYDDVVRLTGDAWNLAATAQGIDSSSATTGDIIRSLAKEMADSARAAKGAASR